MLGAAWLTDWAGLSMALGAFLGGLLLAYSRHRHQIMADIQPFRGLLLGLFFMRVGMSINFGLLGERGLLVVGLVLGLLLTRFGETIARPLAGTPATMPPSIKPIPASRNHVIVAGFGRMGKRLARSLAQAKVPYLVLENNTERVTRAQTLDYPVYFGDASRIDILRSAGAADASMVVFAMDHMESIGQAVVAVRDAFPGLPVYARAWDQSMANRLTALGAGFTVAETLASGQQLTREVLLASGVAAEAAEQITGEDQDIVHRKPARSPGGDRKASYEDILLVLTPGVDERAMLAYAVALALESRADLTVAEVLGEAATGAGENVSSPDELEEQMMENRRARLEALVAQLDVDLDIQTRVLIGRPHEEVTRDVVGNDRDLVVKAVEGGNGLRERLFGDDDFRLLKACPCAVLLVRGLPPEPYRHRVICAGVYQDETPGGPRDDRNAINHRILEQASWLATSQFAELHIVHAWEAYGEQDMKSGRSFLHFDTANYVVSEEQRNRRALNTCLSELKESMDSGVLPAFKPQCHLVKGNHRDEIVRLATEIGADLVVVGDLPHTGLTRLIMDSTADAITRQLKCSVLVVKSDKFVSPVAVDDR